MAEKGQMHKKYISHFGNYTVWHVGEFIQPFFLNPLFLFFFQTLKKIHHPKIEPCSVTTIIIIIILFFSNFKKNLHPPTIEPCSVTAIILMIIFIIIRVIINSHHFHHHLVISKSFSLIAKVVTIIIIFIR